MLTAVKSQFKITFLNIKYALSREMLNKASFISNIIFMILNNASFIIQWVIIFSIKDNISGYSLNKVLILWGLASGTYGVSHFFFKRSYGLSDIITTGQLDTYLVQPKSVLLSAITSDVTPSALGDLLYSYIMLFIVKRSIVSFLLYTLFIICGGIIITAFAVMSGSLSFWFKKSDAIADRVNGLSTNFATYPDGIFKGVVKVLLYTIIPVGFANYLPLKIVFKLNPIFFFIVIFYTIAVVILSSYIFNKGLKKYSSTSLMNARI